MLSAGFTRNIKKKSKRRWRNMIIKIEAVPKLTVEDGVEKTISQCGIEKEHSSQPRAAITAGLSHSQTNWRQRWQKDTDTSMQ